MGIKTGLLDRGSSAVAPRQGVTGTDHGWCPVVWQIKPPRIYSKRQLADGVTMDDHGEVPEVGKDVGTRSSKLLLRVAQIAPAVRFLGPTTGILFTQTVTPLDNALQAETRRE
jgi:hypothetical protein